jgi:hypothetical protein
MSALAPITDYEEAVVTATFHWMATEGGGIRGSAHGRAYELVSPLACRLGDRRRAAEVALLVYVYEEGRDPESLTDEDIAAGVACLLDDRDYREPNGRGAHLPPRNPAWSETLDMTITVITPTGSYDDVPVEWYVSDRAENLGRYSMTPEEKQAIRRAVEDAGGVYVQPIPTPRTGSPYWALDCLPDPQAEAIGLYTPPDYEPLTAEEWKRLADLQSDEGTGP